MRTLALPVCLAVCLACCLGLSITAGEAHATPPFPPAVQAFLGLDYEPHCALCHTDGNLGGLGTVNTPFGKSVRAWGTVAWNVPSLERALGGMEAAQTDSVGDCIPDITKLKAGGNPDVADGGCTCAPVGTAPQGLVPEYGCFARIAPTTGTELPWQGVPLVVALAALMTRRRSRRRNTLSR